MGSDRFQRLKCETIYESTLTNLHFTRNCHCQKKEEKKTTNELKCSNLRSFKFFSYSVIWPTSEHMKTTKKHSWNWFVLNVNMEALVVLCVRWIITKRKLSRKFWLMWFGRIYSRCLLLGFFNLFSLAWWI